MEFLSGSLSPTALDCFAPLAMTGENVAVIARRAAPKQSRGRRHVPANEGSPYRPVKAGLRFSRKEATPSA
jgi:hypothetical protein